MSFPARPYFDIATLADRWRVAPGEIVAWGVAGHLRIAMVMPLVETAPGRRFSGLVEIDAAEVVRLFRTDPLDCVVVYRFRAMGEDDWEIITNPGAGVRICRHDVLVTHRDIEAIERRPGGENAAPQAATVPLDQRKAGKVGRPADSPKHDWESFYAHVTKFVHERGVPKHMADLARVMEEWFTTKDPENVPDLSTIRKKLQPVWSELRAA